MGYSNNYSKTSGSLCKYYRNKPVKEDVGIANSKSFKSKVKITTKPPVDGNTKNAEIAVPLKYLSKFSKTLEMLLIDCKTNDILTLSANSVVSFARETIAFAITDTKLYVSVVTLSTQDNVKLLR